MVTKRLLLLLLLWPFFMWSQTDLVKWYEPDYMPTMLENHISASKISTSSSISINNKEWGNDIFYQIEGWSGSWISTSIDLNKYVQFEVGPETGYSLQLNNLNIRLRAAWGLQKIQIRYSKNSNFSSYQTLLNESNLSLTYKDFNLTFPANTTVNSNEKLYIRIYAYMNNSDIHIEHNNSGTVAPIITGKVSLMTPIAPIANDDKVGTLKNTSTAVNILDNDEYKYTNPITSINVSTPPENGTVSVNGLNNITYTPKNNFVGYDKFYYTLTNSVGVSNTAKVEIQVIDNSGTGVEKVLVRWNKSDLSPTNYTTNVLGSNLSYAGLSIKPENYGNDTTFLLGNLTKPNINSGSLSETNYLQFAIKAGNTNDYTALIKQFQLKYKSDGSGNMTIKYSKDATFKTGVYTLLNDLSYNSSNWTSQNLSFDTTKSFLNPGENLYVRLYVYNTWNVLYIKYNTTNQGPAITGNVSVYYPEPCANVAVWNAGGWSELPNLNKRVIINADYDTAVNGNFEACSVQVNNGKLVVSKDKYIKINKAIDLTGTSTIEVQSDGNLIQDDDTIVNVSKITVKREATLKRLDYNLWGSPVAGQNLKQFSPGTLNNRFYGYNELDNSFYIIDPLVNNFQLGVGYGIRASNTASTTPSTITTSFNGVPNNGIITVKIKKTSNDKGFNLIANPYPSNIDFEKFFANNAGKIDKVAYFWTNFNPTPDQQQGGSYPKNGYYNNYAVYNGSGGVLPTNATPSKMKVPTKVFKVGQGFLVKASQALPVGETDLVFSNDVRTSSTDSNFYNYAARKSSTDEVDRFWLDLETPIGMYSHMLLAYKEGATNNFEWDYDAPAYVNGSDAIYSVLENKKLVIQGRTYPLIESDVVPVGVSFDMSGTHKIALSKKEGIFATGQPIYLHDKLLGTYTNLQNESYSFDAQVGTEESRFEIVYSYGTLGTSNTSKKELLVYSSNGTIYIESDKVFNKIMISDASGRMVYQASANGKSAKVNASNYPAGVYYVTIGSTNGKSTKKIIFK